MHQLWCKTARKSVQKSVKNRHFLAFFDHLKHDCRVGHRRFSQNRPVGHGHFTAFHLHMLDRSLLAVVFRTNRYFGTDGFVSAWIYATQLPGERASGSRPEITPSGANRFPAPGPPIAFLDSRCRLLPNPLLGVSRFETNSPDSPRIPGKHMQFVR